MNEYERALELKEETIANRRGAVAAPALILPIWTALGNAMQGMPSQGNALRCPKT